MSCLTDHDGKLLLSPGDLLDKLSILFIKKQNIKDQKKQKDIQEEIRRVSLLWRNLANTQKSGVSMFIPRMFAKLRALNEKQWILEDRVRVEDSWEAAREARENNAERIEIKNAINFYFGYMQEIKKYKGTEEDDEEMESI